MAIETYSKIDIISKALILCGETPLNSLSDDRYGATVGAALFDMLYESEIQSGSWRFASKKAALSRLVAAPLNQWKYQFQLPTDMLVPVGVYPVDLNYEIYADKLYTDRTSIDLDYRFKPEPTAAPAYFSLMMVLALAKFMIKPITESDKAAAEIEARYNVQRSVALYADAQGRPAKSAAHSPFTAPRHG